MKLWGGRFAESRRDPHFEKYSESFSVDQRLLQYDLQVNQAYVNALGRAGVLKSDEVRQLVRGLEAIRRNIADSRELRQTRQAEDVHTWVEDRLTKEIGPVARKMRTGRSRNDLVATETRLYTKCEIHHLESAIISLLEALVRQARRHLDTVMPGYTHLQPAQPVLFSHYLLAFFEMLARDFDRLENCKARTDELPLGAGALAGTAFPLDRQALARELGFARVTNNSIDATSDRDFVCELLFCCALVMTHLSRLSEDLIIYSSPGFGFVELADAYSTGSSIMPQKKNPDSLELIRGKAATVLGRLTGMLGVMKGLPLAYNRDLQEDKEALFEVGDTVRDSLLLAARVVSTLRVRPDLMEHATSTGFLTATEIADELVRRGVPFADAHEQVGELVRHCTSVRAEAGNSKPRQASTHAASGNNSASFAQLSREEARKYVPQWDSELHKIAVSPQDATRRRNVIGGTAPSQVRRQLRAADRRVVRLKRIANHT